MPFDITLAFAQFLDLMVPYTVGQYVYFCWTVLIQYLFKISFDIFDQIYVVSPKKVRKMRN